MLGGGNPVGSSNPTGIGTQINYIGDLVYGYSGIIPVTDSEKTLLQFTTGSSLLKVKAQFFYATSSLANNNFTYRIKIDGQEIAIYTVNGSGTYTSPNNLIEFIIAPNSKVELTAENTEDASTVNQSVVLTGVIQ